MTNLKKNILHYMERKGIKTQKKLLFMIAKELGYRDTKLYEFPNKENANFSKMLKGERPLKYDFIVPLEKIFGVTLSQLLDEDSYKIPVNKELIPYLKGFGYYAYLDDMDLYKNELTKILDVGKDPFKGYSDEYGKTFIDYAVEFGSKNAIKYLVDEFGIKVGNYFNDYRCTKKTRRNLSTNTGLEFVRLVASLNDKSLFKYIFDVEEMISMHLFVIKEHPLFQDDFFEIILDNDCLFETLFENVKFKLSIRRSLHSKLGKEFNEFLGVNPLINQCLEFGFKNLDKYKEKVHKILDFSQEYNKKTINDLKEKYGEIVIDKFGFIYKDFSFNESIGYIVLTEEIKEDNRVTYIEF